MPKDKVYERAMRARRKVLGNQHVERAIANTRPHTREFQDMIVRYGWSVWTRPGLDHDTRRVLVLGTMVALGRWEEFEMHAAAALEHGVCLDVLKEILIQQAVYCGVPAANTAFHRLNDVIDRLTAKGVNIVGLRS